MDSWRRKKQVGSVVFGRKMCCVRDYCAVNNRRKSNNRRKRTSSLITWSTCNLSEIESWQVTCSASCCALLSI